MPEYEMGLNCGLLDYEHFRPHRTTLLQVHAALSSSDASSFEYIGFDIDPLNDGTMSVQNAFPANADDLPSYIGERTKIR